MRRLNPAPRADAITQPQANDWLQAVTERLGVYQGINDPVLSELPNNQWVLYKNNTTNSVSFFYNDNGVLKKASLTTGGVGDVVGPNVAINNHVVFFDGTTGKLIKDSGLALSGNNTGDQTITLTSDVTGSGTGSFATTIAAGAVTLAKMANIPSNTLIGNNTGVGATPLALTTTQVKGFLTYTAADVGAVPTTTTVNGHALSANVTVTATDVGLGSVTNDAQTKAAIVPNTVPAAGNLLVGNAGGTAYASVASSGDVTVASTGAYTIGAGVVTYAKMQNISATSRLLGRRTAGAGSTEELTTSQALDFVGATQGQVLFRDAANWNILAPGTAGQHLSTGGAGANPSWVSAKRQLANVTLGAGATSLASGTIAACAFLEIHIFITGYAGSDTASLQFNGAAGTAYRYRWLTSAAGGTTFAAGLVAVSTDRIKIGAADTTQARNVTAFVRNIGGVLEKSVQFQSMFATGASGTQDTIDLGNGAWVSPGATQITSVSLISTSNMNTGTQMVIYGWN